MTPYPIYHVALSILNRIMAEAESPGSMLLELSQLLSDKAKALSKRKAREETVVSSDDNEGK